MIPYPEFSRKVRTIFLSLLLITITHGANAVSTLPYGEWVSPITTELMLSDSIRLGAPSFDGDDVYWLDSRPQEAGRSVLVKRNADGTTEDVTPHPFNVRTRVHEYGGGAYLVVDGVAYFVNFGDQRVYRQEHDGALKAITPANSMRYADFAAVPNSTNLIAVREDHSSAREAVTTLVALNNTEESSGIVIVEGNDFYSTPRVSPDGSKLAWLRWNHPNMPWDGTELWVAELSEDATVSNPRRVAGGLRESIFQPAWSPDNVLHFVSDQSGWWNLYRANGESVEALCPMDAEFGQPLWVFGMSTYGFESPTSIVCSYEEKGVGKLARLDTSTKSLSTIETPFNNIGYISTNPTSALFLGGASNKFSQLVRVDLKNDTVATIKKSSPVEVGDEYVSAPVNIDFPTENELTAHAIFYPAANADYDAPEGEKPPLLVLSHGGPTGASDDTMDLSTLFWTSRGIAVVDVNYGGSTGYGREYRERLRERWGIVDVDDCVNAALYLVDQGLVDGDRMAIAGGSAGGYTTLASLTFRDVFKAGASYFGVSDLESLARDTHKFESRYLDSMVGPYPELVDRYHERSPMHHIEGLNNPVIFFQGLDDKVVPPNQAEMMFDALKNKGIPTAYIAFEGEGHGFRQAKNQKRAREAELYFYGKVFGFTPAGDLEAVDIVNERK